MYQKHTGLGCDKCINGEVVVVLNSMKTGVVFSCSLACGFFKEVFF